MIATGYSTSYRRGGRDRHSPDAPARANRDVCRDDVGRRDRGRSGNLGRCFGDFVPHDGVTTRTQQCRYSSWFRPDTQSLPPVKPRIDFRLHVSSRTGYRRDAPPPQPRQTPTSTDAAGGGLRSRQATTGCSPMASSWPAAVDGLRGVRCTNDRQSCEPVDARTPARSNRPRRQ